MVDPDNTSPPRSLKPEDTSSTPKAPLGFQPTSKEDAKINADTAQAKWDKWRRDNIEADNFVDERGGLVYVWQPTAAPVKPDNISDEDWKELQAYRTATGETGPSGEWVLNKEGQLLFEDVLYAEDLAKNYKDSFGTAKSYADIEAPKSKEIARQFQDFENRASLLNDLLQDEQMYGMRADDQNIQNMSAQRDLGLGGVPGGYYTKQPMSSALSNILAPSLPEYVRPDYRLNQSVGLPGAQGFDDEQYDQFGFPRFAFGTAGQPMQDGIQVPPIQIMTWPWGNR